MSFKLHNNRMVTIFLSTAVVMTLAPAAVLAYNGPSGPQHNDTSSQTQARENNNQNRQNNDSRRGHGRHDGRGWGLFCLSADKFQARYDAILAKLDSIVSDNHLTVTNGDTLRANVVSAAATTKTKISELKTLRDSYNRKDATDEEKANFKAKLEETKAALASYRNALKTYKQAVKDAAIAAGVNTPFKLDKKVD